MASPTYSLCQAWRMSSPTSLSRNTRWLYSSLSCSRKMALSRSPYGDARGMFSIRTAVVYSKRRDSRRSDSEKLKEKRVGSGGK